MKRRVRFEKINREFYSAERERFGKSRIWSWSCIL